MHPSAFCADLVSTGVKDVCILGELSARLFAVTVLPEIGFVTGQALGLFSLHLRDSGSFESCLVSSLPIQADGARQSMRCGGQGLGVSDAAAYLRQLLAQPALEIVHRLVNGFDRLLAIDAAV